MAKCTAKELEARWKAWAKNPPMDEVGLKPTKDFSEPWLVMPVDERPYNWKTVDRIAGVKVLENVHGSPFLPDLSGSSKAYILCDSEGRFLQMVEYGSNHMPKRQIGYHAELSLDPSGKPLPHYHEMCWPYRRGPAKALTKAQLKKYAPFMRGRPEYAN